jgi:putative spermidine/putrescine transport system permease protein
MTVLISVLIGVTAATAVNRADIKGKGVLTAFLILPIIIPVIVFAIGIYYIFSGWHFVGKPLSMALAHSVLAIPYVFINTSAAYQTLDPRLEQAALSLGASPIIVFMKITIPLIRTGVLSGMLFAFVVSFDELIVSKYIGGIYVKTLPLQLWDGLRSEMTPIIASVSSLVITCYAIVIIAGQSMKNRANRTAKIMRINEKEMDRDLI